MVVGNRSRLAAASNATAANSAAYHNRIDLKNEHRDMKNIGTSHYETLVRYRLGSAARAPPQIVTWGLRECCVN